MIETAVFVVGVIVILALNWDPKPKVRQNKLPGLRDFW